MNTLARLFRIFCSQFSFHPLNQRPNGISCFTRTRDDEWLLLSLSSIRAFADEVVVIDTIGNLEKTLLRFADEMDMTVKYRFLQPENPNSVLATAKDFIKQTEVGVQESTYKWIMEWNADFIAVEPTMQKLRKMLLNLGETEKRHYYFFLPFVNLAGDIHHTNISLKNDIINPKESFLFRHSKDLVVQQRSPRDPGKIKVPKYYWPIWLKELYYFHVDTVKSAERLLYRQYWWSWIAHVKDKHEITLQDFVKSQIMRDFGTIDVQVAMRKCLLKRLGALRPLSIRLNLYPEILKENLNLFEKYELMSSGEKIISRKDIENYE